jgi:hypothetical protein
MKCPCCRQEIKFIWRKLTPLKIVALELVYEKEEDAGFSIKEVKDKTGKTYEDEIRSLCLWNLVEPLDSLGGDYFVITQEGVDFLKGKCITHRYVKFYGQYEGFDGKLLHILDFKNRARWRISAERWKGSMMRDGTFGRLLRRAGRVALRSLLGMMNYLD